MKKRLLLVLFSLIMLLGVISLAGNVHAEESDPELTVVGCNLSFGSSIYIKYAIYSPDLDGIELLVWTDPQTSYEYGTQKLILNQLDKPETVQGKKCAVFKYTDLAAKQMGDTIYARAHVVRDGIDYYSEVKKYSVLQYAYNKLGRTGTAGTDGLQNLLNNMLNYGGAAQQYFNYDPDRLVTYDWYQVKVVGGTLDDMCYSGLYLPGDKVTLIAPETNENGDTFSAWVNPWGGIAADEATAEITVGEQNLTYTAVYGGSLAYYDNGDGSCTIIGVGNWVGRNLDIPSSIDGLTVTAIESYAFAGNSDITSVTIPESVTRIGDNAFENCTGISDIYYGGTVEQWNNIEFGGNWDKGTGNFVVHCADGDVNLIKPQLVDQNRDELTVGDERFGLHGRNPFKTYISLPESLVGSDLRIFGWISSYSEIKSFGYSINDGEIITGEFEHYTEPIIYTVANAPYASRFEIFAPITEDIQTIKAYLITEKTEEVIWEIHISFIRNEFAFEENGDGTCKITGIGGKTETDLVIPSTIQGLTVTAIGDGAFKECSDITSVTIPDTVTRIESWAFECCLSLRSVVIPDSVNEIGEGAFRVCSNLESITIPNGVTRISNVTFEECTVLTSVVIPGSVTEIGDGAFRDCSNLSSITIPESVTFIENCAFERCTSLESIVIPDGVNQICEGTFRDCSSLSSITIPESVTLIENCAFERCTSLESIVIPDGVNQICDGTFRDCSNLSNVTIPYSVNRIEGWAFERCTGLSDIYYGGTVEQWNAIDKDYYWDSGTNDYVVHCSDGDVNVTKPQLVCVEREELTVNGEGVGNTDYEVSVALPTSMIGENLRLYGWVGSRSAIQGFGYSINDGAIITGDFAAEPEEDIIQVAEWQGAQFASRYAILVPLTEGSYTVKAYMITEKGEEAFWMIHVAVSDEFAYVDNSDGTCTITGRGGHMESELVIPSTIQELTVTQIGDGAFRDCTDITSVTLPESVTIINGWAFEGCSNLMSIVIPENVNEIGDGAFRACSALEGITIPDGVTRIGGATFEGCTGLTSVVLPENVTEIGDGAFRDCSNLSSVTIPYSVNRIEGWAFERCTGLSDIYYGGTVEQWNAIDKDYYWDSGTNDYVVHCSDGDVNVTKPELVCDSREELTVNGVSVGDMWEESVVLPTSMIGENLRLYGWVGSRSAIQGFGYSIDDVEIITGDFAVEPEWEVIQDAEWQGAQYASRYAILVPLTEGSYTVKAYMITEKGEEAFWMIHVAVSDEFAYVDNSDGTCTITGRGGHMESELVIPSTIQGLIVTQIGDGAFHDCTDLTSVTIPETVTVIGYSAFENCDNLQSVEILGNLSEIGGWSFSNCARLESITLPAGVTFIRECAFYCCSSLESVSIPQSVTTIERLAFAECPALTTITYEGTVEQWHSIAFVWGDSWNLDTVGYVVHCADGDTYLRFASRDQVMVDENTDVALHGGNSRVTDVEISSEWIGTDLRIWGWVSPNAEVQAFGYSIDNGDIVTGDFVYPPEDGVIAAAQSPYATRFNVYAPIVDGTYTIKVYMFTETTAEVFWTINVTVFSPIDPFEYIDNGDGTCTVTGRGGHTEADLVIPSKIDGLVVTAIGENAFAGCEGLTSVTFSEKVSVIAENAFEGCTSLTDVFYGGDADQWANIAIAAGNDALTAAEIHYGSLTGTPIGSADDFLGMEDPAGDYYLTDDIYLTDSYGEFSGLFNGNGHTITVENCAVFDTLSGATVKNLIIEGNIERNGNTGGLANQGNNVTVISVTNNANIISNMASKSYYIGGIIGAVLQGDGSADSREYSYFIDCANNGTITASSTTGTPRVGGITGNAAKYQWCVYENCVNNGRLEATASNVSRCPYVGGIAGSAFGGEFTDCVNNGELVSENSAYIGGILSRATPSNQGGDQSVTCTNCINNGTLSCATGDGDYSENTGIGGIIGFAGAESNSNTFAVYSCIDCVNNGDIICGGYYAGGIIGKVQGNENCFELNNEFYHIVHIEGCTNTGNITGLRAAEQVESGTVQEATFVSQFLGFTDTAFNEIVDCKGYGTLTNTNNNYNVIFGIAANEYIPEEISAADILANATVSGIELIENDGTVNFAWSNDMGENGDRAGFRLTLAEYLAIEGNADKIIFVPEIPESGD